MGDRLVWAVGAIRRDAQSVVGGRRSAVAIGAPHFDARGSLATLDLAWTTLFTDTGLQYFGRRWHRVGSRGCLMTFSKLVFRRLLA